MTKQNESLASEVRNDRVSIVDVFLDCLLIMGEQLKEVKGRSDSQLKQIHDLKELVANLQAEARLSAANHNGQSLSY